MAINLIELNESANKAAESQRNQLIDSVTPFFRVADAIEAQKQQRLGEERLAHAYGINLPTDSQIPTSALIQARKIEEARTMKQAQETGLTAQAEALGYPSLTPEQIGSMTPQQVFETRQTIFKRQQAEKLTQQKFAIKQIEDVNKVVDKIQLSVDEDIAKTAVAKINKGKDPQLVQRDAMRIQAKRDGTEKEITSLRNSLYKLGVNRQEVINAGYDTDALIDLQIEQIQKKIDDKGDIKNKKDKETLEKLRIKSQSVVDVIESDKMYQDNTGKFNEQEFLSSDATTSEKERYLIAKRTIDAFSFKPMAPKQTSSQQEASNYLLNKLGNK